MMFIPEAIKFGIVGLCLGATALLMYGKSRRDPSAKLCENVYGPAWLVSVVCLSCAALATFVSFFVWVLK